MVATSFCNMSCTTTMPPKARTNPSWLYKVSTSIGFGALFFTASSGFLLALMVMSSDEPWQYDFDYDSLAQMVSKYVTIEDKTELNNMDFEKLVGMIGMNVMLAKDLLKLVYDLLFYGLFSCSVLLFLIIFFASENRILISAVELSLCALFLGLHWLKINRLGMIISRHDRLFYTLLIINLIGAAGYVVFASNPKQANGKKSK